MLHIEERSSWLRLLLKAFSRSASFSESLFCIRLAQEKERNIDQLNFTQSSSLTSTEVGLRHELMFCCLRLLDLT
jgi:hypothetical protein